MEVTLLAFLQSLRAEGKVVTRRMLQDEAKRMSGDGFKASDGWLRGFFQRHGLSVRRKSTGGQKMPMNHLRLLINFWLKVWKLRYLIIHALLFLLSIT